MTNQLDVDNLVKSLQSIVSNMEEQKKDKKESEKSIVATPIIRAIQTRPRLNSQVALTTQQPAQNTLANFMQTLMYGSGSSEILDPRDAITMLSVGAMFVMACVLALNTAMSSVMVRRIFI